MNAVYDHIIAILVVGMIFVGAVVALPTMSFTNFQAVDQQQLRNTALNVFNAMLFGTGCPSDWGSKFPFYENDVTAFGLAIPEESSMYVLDTDKVQRLDIESPGYISYHRVRELLNLEDYGFSLTLFRPFTVNSNLSIPKETPNRVWFKVNVTRNEDGAPIPNAQVSVTVLATAKPQNKTASSNPVVIVNEVKTYFTNALGRYEGNETLNLPSGYVPDQAVAVMKVTVAGMSTMVTAHAGINLQDVIKINTFGDTLTLSYRGWMQQNLTQEQKNPEGARRIKAIDAFNYDQLSRVWSGSNDPSDNKINQGSGDFQYWNMTFPGLQAMNPALLIFTVEVPIKGLGKTLVIIVGPYSPWGSCEVFSFGPETERVSNVAIRLRRYVVISDMTYIVELALWKE